VSTQTAARRHYQDRTRLARLAEQAAARLWRQVDAANIASSWETLLPRLLAALVAGQRAAAELTDPYLQALDLDGPRVNPSAFAGVASDGRDLETLLRQPVVTSKVALARGAGTTRALTSGQMAVRIIAATQVADTGRVADGVAVAARPQVGYVRMVVGKTCARCLILAGKRYRWNAGFNRHPKCDCIHIPTREDSADDLRTDPNAAFRAMSREEQDQTFGKAGAEAIREGADMARVVNARRGMTTAGGKQFTTEATTRRGAGRAVRLMPEQIYLEARGDRAEAIRLLRLHGYLL
jgi:hypothetical protein